MQAGIGRAGGPNESLAGACRQVSAGPAGRMSRWLERAGGRPGRLGCPAPAARPYQEAGARPCQEAGARPTRSALGSRAAQRPGRLCLQASPEPGGPNAPGDRAASGPGGFRAGRLPGRVWLLKRSVRNSPLPRRCGRWEPLAGACRQPPRPITDWLWCGRRTGRRPVDSAGDPIFSWGRWLLTD